MFFIPIIIFVVFFVVFLVIGLSATKMHKHSADTMTDMISTISAYADKQAKSFEDNIAKYSATKICEYCGSSISASSTKCNSCGAKIKK